MASGLDLERWDGPGYEKGRVVKGWESAVLCAGQVILSDLSGKWELRLGIETWASSDISVSFLFIFLTFSGEG